MRARAAYAAFERCVISLYDQGVLTLDLLDVLASAYWGTHVASAGSKGLVAHDGKDLQQICIALVDPSFALIAKGSRDDNEECWERELRKWSEITRKRWNWRSPGHRDNGLVQDLQHASSARPLLATSVAR